MVASEALDVPAGQVVKTWARVGIRVERSWPMVVVSPPTVKLPSMVALPEIARVVPVAEVKVKLENEPVPPETVAPVMVELVKVPPSVSLARDDERLEESLSDWRVMLGLVSTARICSRRITVLM